MEILGILWEGLQNTLAGIWNGSGEIINLLGVKAGELGEVAQEALNIIAK